MDAVAPTSDRVDTVCPPREPTDLGVLLWDGDENEALAVD